MKSDCSFCGCGINDDGTGHHSAECVDTEAGTKPNQFTPTKNQAMTRITPRMSKERRDELEKLADEDPHMCLVREMLNEIDAMSAELDRLSAQGVDVPELTEEPVVVEEFADNGAHSQWRLVIPSTNTTLWEEATARPAPPHPDTVVASREEWEAMQDLERLYRGTAMPSREMNRVIHSLDAFRAQAQPTEREGT